jgi:hypothetical protein
MADSTTAKQNGARSRLPTGATQRVSYSGTPTWGGGETRPDDYVAELMGPEQRMRMFEEMRSSDGAVNTSLLAREHAVLGANWPVATATDTAAAIEQKEFVEDNLFAGRRLETMLRQLLGALQYGVGMFEPVYRWSDAPLATTIVTGKVKRSTKSGSGRRIYLDQIAKIRQRTIWSFHLDPQNAGVLDTVKQWVYTLDGGFRRVDIPADKLVIWAYAQEGDDYWGRSILRSSYKAWQMKMQLERINVMHYDRFGGGTPVLTGGPDWTDAEFDRVKTFLENWRSQGDNYLVAPAGGSVNLLTAQGTLMASAQAWVAWYALEIAKNTLSMGTELGSTATGSRALGQTMYTSLETVVQADCEHIAQIVNDEIIVPLIDWNFGPQASYPVLQPSPKVQKGKDLADLMKVLADAKAIKLTAEDEAWIRDAIEMPSIDVAARQAEMDQEAAAAQAASDALAAAATTGAGAADGGTPVDRALRRVPGGRAWTARVGTGGVGGGGRRGTRALSIDRSGLTPEYLTWEAALLRPDLLARDLDLQTARLAAEVQDVLHAIDADLADQVTQLSGRGTAALAGGVRDIAVPGSLAARLRRVLFDAAVRARAMGERAVTKEVARQDATAAAPTRAPRTVLGRARALLELRARQFAAQVDPTPADVARDLALSAAVDRAAQDEIDRREAAARGAVLTAIAAAGTLGVAALGREAARGTVAALESLSTARTEDTVSSVVNVGFGVGRRDTADSLAATGRIRNKIYSAVLDANTCDECAKWDGAQFPIDYPEDQTGVSAPNPHCEGGYGRCRCVWIYTLDTESVPVVGPSKGPMVDEPAAPRIAIPEAA